MFTYATSCWIKTKLCQHSLWHRNISQHVQYTVWITDVAHCSYIYCKKKIAYGWAIMHNKITSRCTEHSTLTTCSPSSVWLICSSADIHPEQTPLVAYDLQCKVAAEGCHYQAAAQTRSVLDQLCIIRQTRHQQHHCCQSLLEWSDLEFVPAAKK